MQITVLNKPLHLVKDPKHEFLLSNKEVALGYGITQSTLRSNFNNNQNELTEGKHWIRLHVKTNGGMQKVIHWTKKGIVRLGFFIKSKQAKDFRDWAEDYIVNPINEIDYQLQRENIELKRVMKRLLNNTENKILKQQNLKYYEENDEMKRKLQRIKNIL